VRNVDGRSNTNGCPRRSVGVAALIKTLQIRELKYRNDISWSTYELGILSV